MTSDRDFGMPMTVSTKSPSMNIRPSTCMPSEMKNAETRSRSATVMPMWSRRMSDMVPLPSTSAPAI